MTTEHCRWRSVLRRLGRVCASCARPVIRELPFITAFVLLMDCETLRNLHGRLLTYDPLVSIESLLARIPVCLLMAYTLAAGVCLAGKKWARLAAYVLTLTLFGLQLFLTTVFNMQISPQIFTLLAETNGREATEFLHTFVLSRGSAVTLAAVVTAALLAAAAERIYRRYMLPHMQGRRTRAAVAALTLPALCLGLYYGSTFADLFACESIDQVAKWTGNKFCRPTDPVSMLAYSARGVEVARKEMARAMDATRNMSRDNRIAADGDDSLNVVLVIGESYIKRHASLYGYTLPTTPHLDAERQAGRLFAFDNIVTPYAVTSDVLRNVFCCNSMADGETWYDTPFVPAVFKDAGYQVYFWSNQHDTRSGHIASFALNSLFYDHEMQKAAYTQTNRGMHDFDGELIDDFTQYARLTGRYRLVMFHLMGQHIAAAQRFPHTAENTHFTPADIHRAEHYLDTEKKQKIADYDNATLYNDRVMGRIIALFAHSNSVLVYLSDHGEEVYDYRDSMGRIQGKASPEMLACQYDIPFIVWCSDTYRRRHPDVARRIAAATDRPATSDNLCHLLFSLGNVETPYYHPGHDIIAPGYKPGKRTVVVNGTERLDYDSLRRQKNRGQE